MTYRTCSEIAALYGVTRQAVRYHIKRGLIPAIRGENNILLIPDNAPLPAAWLHGEKGKTANAKWRAANES